MSKYPVVKKTMMPTFDVRDLPLDVVEDCLEHDLLMPSGGVIDNVYWEDEGGPLVEWLKAQGLVFEDGSVWFGLLDA